MKLASHFSEFLKDTVNLNVTRITTLEEHSTAIQNFIREAGWDARVLGFEEQGSWAHDTIIRPVDQGEFDADLLVRVEPVEGWGAANYIKTLVDLFRGSGTYRDKVKGHDYCATITYANFAMIDIAPLVVSRQVNDRLEVCNKAKDQFERSEPTAYTAWLVEKNSYSGGNSFRKVTRLIKHLRDIKGRFHCPSVLLTTLLAHQIGPDDKDSDAFADVPTALQTVMGRLDDWLQSCSSKPKVYNPFLATGESAEDFARDWSEAQFENFQTSIHRYREWIDEAVEAEDRDSSVKAWRRLFGDAFAPSVELKEAVEGRFALASPQDAQRGLLQDLVDLVVMFGRSAIPRNFRRVRHMHAPKWAERRDPDLDVVVRATIGGGPKHMYAQPVQSGEPVKPGQKIYFEAVREDGSPLGAQYDVHWRITNTGNVPNLRGDFYESKEGHEREETLDWRGVHLSEAFVVRRADGSIAAVSDPFYVVIAT